MKYISQCSGERSKVKNWQNVEKRENLKFFRIPSVFNFWPLPLWCQPSLAWSMSIIYIVCKLVANLFEEEKTKLPWNHIKWSLRSLGGVFLNFDCGRCHRPSSRFHKHGSTFSHFYLGCWKNNRRRSRNLSGRCSQPCRCSWWFHNVLGSGASPGHPCPSCERRRQCWTLCSNTCRGSPGPAWSLRAESVFPHTSVLAGQSLHPGVCLEISVHPFNSAVDISQSWSGLSRCWSGLQRREDHEEEEGEAKVVHNVRLESWHRSKLDDVSTDRLFIHE